MTKVPVELTVDPAASNPWEWLEKTFQTQKELDRWLEETGYWAIQAAWETLRQEPAPVEIPPGLQNKDTK